MDLDSNYQPQCQPEPLPGSHVSECRSPTTDEPEFRPFNCPGLNAKWQVSLLPAVEAKSILEDMKYSYREDRLIQWV